MDPRLARAALLPGEEGAVAKAVESRKREFSAGRACARLAMAALGAPALPIPQGADRAPIWPEGLVGSITHTEGWCAAAVARRSDGVRALGLDVEPAAPLDAPLLRIICVAEERAFVGERGLLGRLIFSAKESAYKAQYQLSRTLLGFHAMQILLDEQAQRFVAVFRKDVAPFSRGDELQGRFLLEKDFLMTAVTISA